MTISRVPPLHYNVPIVDPNTGAPTPALMTIFQILLDEKGVTDALADSALQPGTITTSGLTEAAQTLLGNKEGATGAIEELTLSQALDLIGSAAQGDILFRGASGWERLPAGTSGQFLKTLGAGADPAWAAASGGGGSSYERTRVVPTASQFTLENAGTASVADGTYGMILTVPNVASNIRFLRYTAGPPAMPYSMIVRNAPISVSSSGGLYQRCLIARNSTSGKIIIMGDYNSGSYLVQRWSGYTVFAANALAPTNAWFQQEGRWFKMTNDGANLTFSSSPDGEDWFGFWTEPLATYIGSVDQVGVGTMMNSHGSTSVASFQSFEIG